MEGVLNFVGDISVKLVLSVVKFRKQHERYF
jgi:hypothetical protein